MIFDLKKTDENQNTTALKKTTVEKKGTERMSVASGSEKAIGGKVANTKGAIGAPTRRKNLESS